MKRKETPFILSKIHLMLLVASIVVIAVLFLVISQNNFFGGDTLENSKTTATNFMTNSPTYKFDGYSLNYISTNVLRCSYCWEHVFSFVSKYSGYGDRTGKAVSINITFHEEKVKVENGKVSSAIIDSRWDELNQKMIK